ncbi:TPA: hypothetical protein ACPTSI_005204, partial [Escherichia coli]
ICPYISRYLLSLNPLLTCCRRYSRGKLYPEEFKVEAVKQVVERGDSVRTAINYCYNNIYFLFYFVLACKNLEKGGV